MCWDFKPVCCRLVSTYLLYAFTTAAFMCAKQASAAIVLLNGTKASKNTRKSLPHGGPSMTPSSGRENSHIDI